MENCSTRTPQNLAARKWPNSCTSTRMPNAMMKETIATRTCISERALPQAHPGPRFWGGRQKRSYTRWTAAEITSRARVRAWESASNTPAMVSGWCTGVRSSTSSIVRGIPGNDISLARKASTAISSAAFESDAMGSALLCSFVGEAQAGEAGEIRGLEVDLESAARSKVSVEAGRSG